MDNLTTTTNPPSVVQRTNTFAAAVMLRHSLPVMVLEKTAVNTVLPKNKGDSIKWRRVVTFTAVTTPLVEGITPQGRRFDVEDVTAVLKQYGDYSRFSDVVADLHEDPIGREIAAQHGENIGRTFEALDWGVVRAGTNRSFTNGTARNAVNTPVTIQAIRKVVRSLTNQKAMRFTNVLDGSPKFATRGIEAAFIAIGHTNLENDIRNLPGFIPAAQYGTRTLISEHELGSVENVRFVLSPDLDAFADAGGALAGSGTAMLSTSGTSADVYPLVFFGKDAWARVSLRVSPAGEMPITVLTKMPNGEISDSDPLAQRGIVSWKGYYAAKILNEAWLHRLETAATAL